MLARRSALAPSALAPTRFSAGLDAMMRAQTRRADAEASMLRILAGSFDAPVMRAVWATMPELALRGVTVSVCVARPPRGRAARAMLERFSEVYGEQALAQRIAVSTPRAARGLFEQAVLGRTALWTGAPLRSVRGAALGEGELSWTAKSPQAAQAASVARLLDASVWEVARPIVGGRRRVETRVWRRASAPAR